MNRSMSRLVTCLGLQHPQRLDFLNSNTCFCSRLYGIYEAAFLSIYAIQKVMLKPQSLDAFLVIIYIMRCFLCFFNANFCVSKLVKCRESASALCDLTRKNRGNRVQPEMYIVYMHKIMSENQKKISLNRWRIEIQMRLYDCFDSNVTAVQWLERIGCKYAGMSEKKFGGGV